jgi:hypothetical protein
MNARCGCQEEVTVVYRRSIDQLGRLKCKALTARCEVEGAGTVPRRISFDLDPSRALGGSLKLDGGRTNDFNDSALPNRSNVFDTSKDME